MGKTPKVKNKSQSVHSRAARRAASPSLDLDKSLTSLPRAESNAVQRDSILSQHANAGVSKKQSKPKPKSKSQRLRQQKGIERAEVVMDQLEKKVAKSVGRGKTVKARRADWDELNHKSSSMFAALQVDTLDDNADDAMADDSAPVESHNKKPVVLQPTPQGHLARNPVVEQHAAINEEDEIT